MRSVTNDPACFMEFGLIQRIKQGSASSNLVIKWVKEFCRKKINIIIKNYILVAKKNVMVDSFIGILFTILICIILFKIKTKYDKTTLSLAWRDRVRRLTIDPVVMRSSTATGHISYALLVN